MRNYREITPEDNKAIAQIIRDNLKAREMNFAKMYLETHTNLDIAIKLYERVGYKRIERPEFVVHSTMNRFYLKDL